MNYKTILLCLFGLFMNRLMLAQVAIIADADGYVNVRSGASVESDVVYKLKENEVFGYDVESFEGSSDWIEIFSNVNKLSITNASRGNFTSGFMHRSRIKPLTELKLAISEEFKFSLKTEKFISTQHTIGRTNGFVVAINGLYPYGIDGYKPNTQISQIEYSIQDITYVIPVMLYQDLFNPGEKVVVYKDNNVHFVSSQNSDGAGSYDLVWVIDSDGVLLQRFVSISY